MPPAIKVVIPPGKIGVSFKNTDPPAVSGVSDQSPLKGKVKPGYLFDTLYLADGTEFTGLTSKELIQTLADYDDEEVRKIKFRLALPKSIKVTIPPGEAGITVEGDPPLITSIARTSPLKDTIRAGLAVDSLALEDGTEYIGYSAEEIVRCLEDDANDEIIMELKNPEAVSLSTRSTTLPKSKTVTLPSGMIGTVFQGSPSKVARMTPESPMRGIFRLGMVVDSLTLPDGTEYRGIKASHLSKTLTASASVEGRVLLLKNPDARDLPQKSTTKVPLPVGDIGLKFVGEPAVIDEVAETSPLAGKVWAGQLVDTIVLPDGTEYDELDGLETMDILEESADSEGRFLLLTNFDEVVKTPDEIEVILPAERLGVTFQGSPPVISQVAKDSPVRDEFTVGLAVDTVTLADGSIHMELATSTLVKMLRDTADMEGRKVVLKNPATTKFTRKPAVVEVSLPRGKLGVVFVGTPPKVSRFLEGSPMVGKLLVGMVVDILTLADGTMLAGLSVKELVEALNESDETDGRTMLLKNPATRRLSARQILPPDEKEVVLPPGSLGVSFKGELGKITRILDDSPVKGLFREGMVIDTLILPDGSTYSGLSAKELGVVLRGSSDLEGRRAILKNPETSALSDRKMIENDPETAFFEDDEADEVSQRG